MYEKDPPGVPRVPILGPNCGMFSKLNKPGPLGPGGHSYTFFCNGRFQGAQRSFGCDVNIRSKMDVSSATSFKCSCATYRAYGAWNAGHACFIAGQLAVCSLKTTAESTV